MPDTCKCPKCEGQNFKHWKLPHPLVLHWILNPALAFNELVLGQRMPKVMLVCKDCKNPVMDRTYVPCPSCDSMHWGRLWSGKRVFGNWRGLSCPSCGKSIPCLWNVFSLLILAITSPVWILPYLLYFQKKPPRALYDSQEIPPVKPFPKKTWIIMGALWGIFMWIFSFLIPELDYPKGVLPGVFIWALGGLMFGFFMWLVLGRKK